MAISVQPSSQFTTQFPSGSFTNIKFSKLRDVFKGPQGVLAPVGIITSPGVQITARELLRDTNVTPTAPEYQTDPIVPDATENSAVATSSNWKVSQFKDTIKFYVLDQTSSDNQLNLNTSTVNWNGNLAKSIRKFVTIRGTVYSTSSGTAAIRLTESSNNVSMLMIDTGRVYASGGTAGTQSSRNGGYGGDAMQIISGAGKVKVYVYNGTNIYAGGGGGAVGATGDTGPSGSCPRRESYETGCNCGGCPGCNGGWNRFGCPGCGGCNCGKGGCRQQQYRAQCERTVYDTRPGYPGGLGGNGAAGRGWNNFSGGRTGSGGATAVSSGCYTYGNPNGSNGVTGETGGNSGDWADAGSSTDTSGSGQWQGNGGTGGQPGRAMYGSNYSVEGTINSATIKGAYNP